MTAFAGIICLIVSQMRRIRDRWTDNGKPDAVLFVVGLALVLTALSVPAAILPSHPETPTPSIQK